MAGQVTFIGGKLYYSSVTAGAGAYGTTSLWGGQAIKGPNGQLWFPAFGNTPTATAAAPAAPAPPAAQPVGEAVAAAQGGAISNTKMPISWGDRRIYGKVVDHIIKALDPDTGIGAETLCISAGEPLFKDVPNNLYKILSGSTVLYDETQGGVVHPAVDAVTWYDGTSDDQPQDPLFVEKFGADVVPGYIGQMIAVIDFNTYEPWVGKRPEPFTIFIQDAVGGKRYRPWGGTWSPDHQASNIDLSDGDKTATTNVDNNGGMVRGTVGHSAGRWYFELIVNASGGTANSFGICNQRWGMIGPDADWETGSLGAGGEYLNKSVAVDLNNNNFVGGFLGAWNFNCPHSVGARIGVAVDLDEKHWWAAPDGVSWYGVSVEPGTVAYPLESIGSFTTLTSLTEPVLYLAFQGYDLGDSITIYTTLDEFAWEPPAPESGTTEGEIRNWGEVFVELAKISNLDPNHVITQDITAGSVGGIIYDGLAWSDMITNAGKIENIDWWEDGQDIYIRQTANDNPATDVAAIPSSHRYVIDENKGATDAERGGERRKPVVYSIGYYDVSRQFQESFMMARSEAFVSVREEKLSTPFVMTATEAATRSAIALGKTEMEFEEHHFELPPMVPYVQLRPADIVEFDEESRPFKTKVSNWTLETDWTIKTSYRKLFTTATNPVVPFESEIITANMPEYLPVWFTEPVNSGRWTLFEDI
jgi:hypothetical protein